MIDKIHKKDTMQLYRHLKNSAVRRGIPFDISITEFSNITIPISCPVLGIPLTYNDGKAKDNSISFDRIDSSKGYTFDNIVVVSNRVNKLKSNATFDEMKKIFEYYQELEKCQRHFSND